MVKIRAKHEPPTMWNRCFLPNLATNYFPSEVHVIGSDLNSETDSSCGCSPSLTAHSLTICFIILCVQYLSFLLPPHVCWSCWSISDNNNDPMAAAAVSSAFQKSLHCIYHRHTCYNFYPGEEFLLKSVLRILHHGKMLEFSSGGRSIQILITNITLKILHFK